MIIKIVIIAVIVLGLAVFFGLPILVDWIEDRKR